MEPYEHMASLAVWLKHHADVAHDKGNVQDAVWLESLAAQTRSGVFAGDELLSEQVLDASRDHLAMMLEAGNASQRSVALHAHDHASDVVWDWEERLLPNLRSQSSSRQVQETGFDGASDQVVELLQKKPAPFLTTLESELREVSEKAWTSPHGRDSDRWYVFKEAASLVRDNLMEPVPDVVEKLMKEAKNQVRIHDEGYGIGKASADLFEFVKSFCGE